MTHLGRWLSALIDGELDDVERDRVLNHLAGCLPCRLEANELRAIKRRMVALGDTSADPGVAGRLIDLARAGVAGAAGAAGSPSVPWLPGLTPAPAWWARQARNAWLLAGTSAGAAVVAIGVAAFLLGGLRAAAPEPKVTPAVYVYWLQHSYDTGQVPAGGPGAGTVSPSTAPAVGGTARRAVAPGARAATSSARVPAASVPASRPAAATTTPTPPPSSRP